MTVMRQALLWAGLLVAAVAMGACTDSPEEGPVTVHPGAPGDPGEVRTGEPRPPHDEPHTAADVHFVHMMIEHHSQALRMTELAPERTDHSEIVLLAARIELSQEAEIALMEDWLEVRGEPTSDDQHDPDLMPGMVTEDQFAELSAATGADFDRRFLELMIHHHEGALIMVDELRSVGGAQGVELAELTNHIDIDQRIEIDRMRDLLAELG